MKFLNEIDGASKVIQDANNRFVTDSEKSTWNGKQNAITGGASTITSSNLTSNRALVSDSSGKVTVSSVTSTELGYVSGVTSSIQTQLNGKASTSHSHAISDVSGLQTALNGKSDSAHNHTLDGLSNTTITSNTNGEILRWNGSAWVNNTLAEAGIASASHSHTISDTSGLQTALDSKADIDGKAYGSWQIGEKIYNVARCLFTNTPTEILIKTGIPFISGSHMPVIHIEGYAYGLQSPIELKIGYYVYANAHGYCGAVSMGAWRPTIKLFSYLGVDGITKYTGIALIGSIYFPQFSVHVQTEMGGNYKDGWSITSNGDDNAVYHMPNTDVYTVPYKPTFSSLINGVEFNGTSDITITASANGGNSDTVDGKHASDFATSTHNHTLDSLSNTTITSNTSGEILKWNGTAWINNTLAEAGIAPSSHTHTRSQITDLGTVASINTNASTSNYLRGDGTWVTPPNTTYSVATTSANGLMSSTDKTKLDGIATGANNYTHPATHPPSIIAQDSNNRFTSDSEKSSWNAKAEITLGTVQPSSGWWFQVIG